MARVFISHSSRDNNHAADIKKHLWKEGVDTVFLDIDEHSGIQPGADWERKLYQEIDSAHAVVLVLTPAWLDSKWCFVEFAQARALGKAIFPVIVAPGGEKFFAPDIQHLDLRTDREGGLARLSRAVSDLALDTQGGFAWDRNRPPYPGLLSFEAEDAAIFFGRDDDIRRLIERLNARRVQGGSKLVVVLGASGSGKSSLIRAGVLPRLARDKRNWIVLPPFRPRLDPTVELARAATERLGNLDEWKTWRERLTAADAGSELASIAETFRVKAGARDATILITVDQAEELLTVTPADKAREFWTLLKTATAEDSPFLILMTLRSDYLGLLQKATEGVTRFEEFSLGPMPLDRVRQIIEGPARVAGLHVEEGLVLAAAADAGSDDALPLLAFTLRELYDRYGARRAPGERQLLLAQYKELGDPAADLTPLENSVRKRADELIAAIDPAPDELDALRAAFVGPLVRVNDKGEYVRNPARLADLPEKAKAILQKLTDARLLVTRDDGGHQTVEVAHEALLRKWPRLRAWLDEEREFLIGKSRLEDALADWEKAPDADKPSALLQGLALSRASQWLVDHPHAISEAERAFIEASAAKARAEARRRTRNRIALAAGVLLLLAGAGVGFMQVQAQRREAEALQRGVDATRLAFQSGVFLGANDVPNAVKTAVKAEETLSTPETRSALLQSLLALSPHLAESLTVHEFQPLLLAGAAGAKDVLIGSQSGAVEAWDPATRAASRSVVAFKPKDPKSQIKPALRALAAVDAGESRALLDDGRLVAFDPASGSELAKAAELTEEISKAAIGESGRFIVASSVTTGDISAFTCAKEGKIEPRLACERAAVAQGYADAVAVSERAGLAAIGLEQGGLILAKLGKTSPEIETIELPEAARVGAIAFDPSGSRFAFGTMAGAIFVRDLQGNQIALPAQTAPITALAFDVDGSRLATACDGFAVCIWKLPQALGEGRAGEVELLVKLFGHTNTVRAVRFGPGSDAVVSASVDESVKAWTIDAVDRVSFALPVSARPALTDLDISSDRKWLAASDVKGGVALWDLKTLSPLRPLPPLRDAEIMSVRWHPTESRLAQSDKKGWVAIRPAEEGAPPQEIQIDENGNTVDVVRWLPEGKAVVAGLFGGEIKEWEGAGQPVTFAERHPDAVQALAIDARAGRLYSSDSLGNLWSWELASRKRLAQFPASGEAQDSISLTRDGKIALTGGNGVHAFLYDLEAAKIAQGIAVGAQSEGAAFSPDDKYFAIVDTEAKLHLWLYPENEVYASVKVYPDALSEKVEGATHLSRLTWLPELLAVAISTSRGEVKLVSYDVAAWRQRAKSVFLTK
jgi:WD40 repeat protein